MIFKIKPCEPFQAYMYLDKVPYLYMPVAYFTKEVNPRLAKRPLVLNGRLAYRGLTALVKEATGRQACVKRPVSVLAASRAAAKPLYMPCRGTALVARLAERTVTDTG